MYFKGLISEKQVIRKEKGQVVTVWENIAKDRRNEPLDLRVYNLAALRLLKPNFEALEKRLKEASSSEEDFSNSKKKVPQKQYGCIKRTDI